MDVLNDLMRDIQAMKEDLLIFERKYGIPSEFFYEFYQRNEEPPVNVCSLDWSEWAATYEILQERLTRYRETVGQILTDSPATDLSQLIEHATFRHVAVWSEETFLLSRTTMLVSSI